MGQCVSKPPDGMAYTAPPGAGPSQSPGAPVPGGNAAAAAATYQQHNEPSAHAQHMSLAKRSFRTSNRSVIEGLASIYQVKTVLGSGASAPVAAPVLGLAG